MDNPNQKNAIQAPLGPTFVMAGPGTGKTYTITHRIFYLIHSLQVLPSQILVFTFTQNAANEMKMRYRQLDQASFLNVTFGTFHSVFYSFLSKYHYNYLPIISQKEQFDIVSMITKDTDYERVDLITLLGMISRKKCDLSNSYLDDELVYQYEELKKSIGKMDFDDIMISFYQMLIKRPDLLQEIKRTYSHILIDEFQDINSIQYQIVRLISSDHIFAVGDDAQSIYGFRGSSPGIIRQFINDYPNTNYIELILNFRSYEEIIRPSEKFISQNMELMARTPQVFFKTDREGSFKIIEFLSKKDQSAFLRAQIIDDVNKGKRIAILARTNRDVAIYQSMFEQSDYDFECIMQVILRDLSNYISFIIKDDRTSLLQILNRPTRYIPEYIFTTGSDLNELMKNNLLLRKYPNLGPFLRTVFMLRKTTPYAFLQYLFSVVKYLEFISGCYGSKYDDKIKQFLESLLEKSKSMKSNDELLDYIKSLFRPRNRKYVSNQISILTYHASKGLEFDSVYLPDLNEGNVPGKISQKEDGLEEEKRLFYVAMTRAKEKLIISYIRKEDDERLLPSSFLNSIVDFSCIDTLNENL